MIVQLNDEYRIKEDELSYILQRKTKKGDYINKYYYGSIDKLIEGLLDSHIQTSSIDDLKALREDLKNYKNEIMNKIKEIKE